MTLPVAASYAQIGDEVYELETLEVKSFTEGLEKSMQQTKNSLNLRNIINADDMGKLPDDNAAEAVSRLPGIFMSDDEGEGRYIAIRGVTANLNNITLNGQTIAASDTNGQDGRAAPLDILSAASISEIEVVKSLTPDMDLGSVGGAINIKTRTPFHNDGNPYEKLSLSYGTNTQNNGQPNVGFSFMKSATFGPDNTWGLLVGGNYTNTEIISFNYENGSLRSLGAEKDADGNNTGSKDYKNEAGEKNEFGDLLYFEQNLLQGEWRERERKGTNINLEFKPSDDTHAWLRYYWTESVDTEVGWRQNYRAREVHNDKRSVLLSPTNGYSQKSRVTGVFDDQTQERPVNQIVLGGEKKFGDLLIESNVVMTNAKEWRPYDYRLEIEQESRTQDIDGDAPYDFKDNPNYDNSVVSWRENSEGFMDYTLIDHNYDFVREAAADTNDTKRLWPTVKSGQDLGWDQVGFYTMNEQQFNPTFVEEDAMTANLDITWDTQMGDKALTLATGLKYLDRDKYVEKTSIRYDPENGDTFIDGTGLNATGKNLYRPFSDIFGEEKFSYGPMAGLMTWLPDREALRAELAAQNAAEDSGEPINFEYDHNQSVKNSAEDDYYLTEEISAAYAMFNLEVTPRFNLFGGARYEETSALMQTQLVTETPIPLFENDGTTPVLDDETGRQIIGVKVNLLGEVYTPAKYENFAPNLQFRWAPKDNLVVRGAMTQTIGRPDYVDLGSPGNAAFDIEFEDNDTEFDYSDDYEFEGEAALPNPTLQPYESTNYDFSVAHYFDDNKGYVSVGGYYKHIENPIYDSSVAEYDVPMASLVDRFGLHADTPWLTELSPEDSMLNTLEIESVINGTPQQVWGYEFEFQRTFDDFMPDALQGFGMVLNYTIQDSEVTIPIRPLELLPLEDQATELYNAQLYYSRHGWDARIAFRHQGEALDRIAHMPGIVGRNHDRWLETREFLDVFVSYHLTENLRVSLSGRNLGDEAKQRYYIDPSMNRRRGGLEQYGTNYELALSWSR